MDTGSGQKNNNSYYCGSSPYAPCDNISQAVSLIEVKTNPVKRAWLKIVSTCISFVFLFQQLAFSDIYDHKRLGGIGEELMQSGREQSQRNKFAPSYLNRQQQTRRQACC